MVNGSDHTSEKNTAREKYNEVMGTWNRSQKHYGRPLTLKIKLGQFCTGLV